MTAIQAISTALGCGKGYLYIKDTDGNVTTHDNTPEGVDAVRNHAYLKQPYGFNKRAVGSIKINSVEGTGAVDTIGILGVNQLSSSETFDTLTPAQLVTNLANNINAIDVGATDYDAVADSDVLILLAPLDAGSSHNGVGVSFVTSGTGTVSTTITKPSGGFSIGDKSLGDLIYLDANFDLGGSITCTREALPGTIDDTYAIDITDALTPRFPNIGCDIQSIALVSDEVKFTRRDNFTLASVTAESGVTDDLSSISTDGVSDGDRIGIRLGDSGHTITCKDTAAGNVRHAGSPDNFVIDSQVKYIEYRYNLADDVWRECFRTMYMDITDALLRTNNISVGLSGSTYYEILAAGGTRTFTPGTDAKNMILDGTGKTLTASFTFDFGGTPIDGDPVYVHYLPVTSVKDNTVTLGGITLTQDQAETGVVMIAFYDAANATWRSKILVDAATTFVRQEKIPTNELPSTKLEVQAGVTAGTYEYAKVTVDRQGVVTAVENMPPPNGYWYGPITKDYSDFAAAALTNDIEIYSLPAGYEIAGAFIKHSTAFSGDAITAYTISIGILGTLNKYQAAFDVFQAVGATVFDITKLTSGTVENWLEAISIRAAATATGANLDQATAGEVDIYLCLAKIKP